jgi:hemerythrin superfamily protein
MPQRKRSATRSATRKAANGRRASSRRPRARKPDAISLLKEDHARVRRLFDRFERTRGESEKERLAKMICDDLTLHTQLEEQTFYPAVREAIDEEDLVNEAEVEHQAAKDLIDQIRASSPTDPRYDALVTVLGEYVKHHVGEEEGEMFKQVRASELDLTALGEQMKERKRTLQSGGEGITGRITSMLGSNN